MIKVPEGAPGLPEGSLPGGRSNRVTSLMDIYPTLLDLAGLRPKADLDGRSLAPLLRDPSAPWDHVAITTYDFSEFAVRTEDWSYIRYIDDSEELYNFESDPEEWHNVADDPRYEEIRRDLASRIPENPHPLVDTSFKLQPHHLPPYKSKAEYEAKRTQIQGGAE